MIIVDLIPVPTVPASFNVSGKFEEISNTTITFSWDPPQGSGVITIVDDYIISISPKPLSHPITNILNSTSINVTLEYNVEYIAVLEAINCAGKSDAIFLNVEFGKLLSISYLYLIR